MPPNVFFPPAGGIRATPIINYRYRVPIWGGGGDGPTGIFRPAPGAPGGGGGSITQLQQIYQTNPTSLSPEQWAALQAAGAIPSTLPYSSASLQPSAGSTAGAPATSAPTPAPASGFDVGSFLSNSYGGLAVWQWGLIAGGAYFVFGQKKGR